ncbi:MAG: hypothetical protein FJW95_00905 [Actinobacteria bacterium]|nr:hypothetical protein [Actinomycetota bacterium]
MKGELASRRLRVPADPLEFYEYSLREGFGDGLPLLLPRESTVAAMLDHTPLAPGDLLGMLAPAANDVTVEKVAVNAAMAGVEPRAFGYVVAALEAIMAPGFNWSAVAATTSSVTPILVVNGPRRAELGFDMQGGCMGGAGGRGSSTIGRAVQLCLRNLGGQRVPTTSKSVFGQPARVSGLCVGEWEEESPWPSLAQRAGFGAMEEVVTVHASKGTFPLVDIHNDAVGDLLALVGRSLAVPLTNLMVEVIASRGETMVAFNPVWAQRFGAEFPEIGDLQAFVHEHAWQPIDLWPEGNQEILRTLGRVDDDGRVHLARAPEQLVPIVCGGRGSLHAIALPSWGETIMQSVAVRS